jgi:hypothetical protein
MITRILFIALAMLGLTLSPDAYALKLEGFNIKQVVAGNDYPAIRVKFNHSTDNWTDVTSDMVEVKIEYRVDVKSAYALANSEISISLDNMYAEEGLHSSNSNYSELHIGTLRLRKPGNQLEEIKDTALDICNQIRGNGGKPNKEHRITRTFTASGHIDAYNTGPFFTEEMADDDKLMRVDVICEKDPTWHGPIQPKDIGLGAAAPDFKVIKLDLFLTTFANQYTTPSAGTRCQKLQVKLRIETSKEGQLSYTLWRQPGEKIHKVKFVSFQDSGPFKGRFVHEEVLWETFDKTTFQQYMLETPGIPVGMSTPWKEKHIICKGPGPGGLTTGPGPGGSPGSELPAFRVIDANVMLQRLPGNACPACQGDRHLPRQHEGRLRASRRLHQWLQPGRHTAGHGSHQRNQLRREARLPHRGAAEWRADLFGTPNQVGPRAGGEEAAGAVRGPAAGHPRKAQTVTAALRTGAIRVR